MARERGLELLAPAGNLEILKGVADAGADAVYFGGDLFGARAYAANFTMKEAEEGIRYAHLLGAKTYLTVNTLLKNREIERDLHDYLRQYRELGIDAVIVQDMAVLDMLRSDFGDLAIHASTQMSICGDGAALLKELGVTRVVTARELSLPEIAGIYRSTGLEIETFVHGALCYCYSGQCLFSSLIGGRSGNRGRCAQPCRLPYEVYRNGKRVLTPGPYVLSPKDLCGIRAIKALYDAGVYSLKIEGRMKQKEYAAGVVAMYRKYVDLFLEDKSRQPQVAKEDYDRLLSLGNRCGFTDAYYFKPNARDMISFSDPSHKHSGGLQEEAKRRRTVSGSLSIRIGCPAALTLTCGDLAVTATGPTVTEARNQPITKEEAEEKVRALGNTAFIMDQLAIDMDQAAFLPAKTLKSLRREAVEGLEAAILSQPRPKSPQSDALEAGAGFSPFHCKGEADGKTGDPRQRIFACCTTKDQMEEVLRAPFVTTVCLDHNLAGELLPEERKRIRQAGKKCYLRLPDVMRHLSRTMELFLRSAAADYDGLLVPSYDGLEFAARHMASMEIVCDHRLYTYSNAALAAFGKLGLERFCAPVELNLKELKHRANGRDQMIIYGYLPLMITAGCMNQSTSGCTHQRSTYELKDRKGNYFSYVNDCSICTSRLYNSAVLCLFEEMDALAPCGFAEYRMDFTIESREIVGKVLTSYGNMLAGRTYSLPERITKGHLYRGVE